MGVPEFLVDSTIPIVLVDRHLAEALPVIHQEHCNHKNIMTENWRRGQDSTVFDEALRDFSLLEDVVFVQFCPACPTGNRIEAIILCPPLIRDVISDWLREFPNFKHVDIDYIVLDADNNFVCALEATSKGYLDPGSSKNIRFKAMFLTEEFSKALGGWAVQVVHPRNSCNTMYVKTVEAPAASVLPTGTRFNLEEFKLWLKSAVGG